MEMEIANCTVRDAFLKGELNAKSFYMYSIHINAK